MDSELNTSYVLDFVNSKETGSKVLTALTFFVNILITGSCPSQVIPILFCSNLLALEENTSDIHPIAVGYV